MTILLTTCIVGIAWLLSTRILYGRRTRPYAVRSSYGLLLGSLAVLPFLIPLLEPTRPQIWGFEGMDPALLLVEGVVPAAAYHLFEALLFGQGPYVGWWIGLLALGWLIGGLLLFRAMVDVRRIGRDGVDVAAEVRAVLGSDGVGVPLPPAVRVVEHPGVLTPALIASLHTTIILPSDWRDVPPAALRHALLHELEHVHARDHWRRLASHIVRGGLWFHPLAWHFARRYEQAVERLADERVLQRGIPPTAYAETLLFWAARRSGLRVRHPGLGVAGQLGRRVEHVLGFRERRRGWKGWGTLAVFGFLMMSASLIGGTHCDEAGYVAPHEVGDARP